MTRTADTHFTTFLTHIGGTVIGIFTIRRIGYARQTWKYAAIYAAVIFILSRLFTAPELNVNLSHTFYPGWEMVFHFYWQYFLFLAGQVLLGLYLLSILLERFFPPPGT
jgi:hypothetical protein